MSYKMKTTMKQGSEHNIVNGQNKESIHIISFTLINLTHITLLRTAHTLLSQKELINKQFPYRKLNIICKCGEKMTSVLARCTFHQLPPINNQRNRLLLKATFLAFSPRTLTFCIIGRKIYTLLCNTQRTKCKQTVTKEII